MKSGKIQPMMKNKIKNIIKDAKSIGIAGHISPDGDCIGSCMALYHYLKMNLPKDIMIHVYFESIPGEFASIVNDGKTKDISSGSTDSDSLCESSLCSIRLNDKYDIKYDLFISLDSGDLKRLGFAKSYFLEAKKTINIDHHISNTNFGQVNYVVDHASSTCEVLFDLFDEDKINEKIAKCLYLGIVHDTGIFTYGNTSEKTMNIAGKLMAKGIPFTNMIDETYRQKTYLQNQLLGRCLLESTLLLDGKCIVSYMSREMMEFYHAESTDLSGIVSQLRLTKGVEVAIFIHQLKEETYKVSMRSNEVADVQKIAFQLGGGGHTKAAGCTMHGSVSDIINTLTLEIEKQLIEKEYKD
jgi:bifunctional oligoribonuclease and PAP phosphatase NrnA